MNEQTAAADRCVRKVDLGAEFRSRRMVNGARLVEMIDYKPEFTENPRNEHRIGAESGMVERCEDSVYRGYT